MDAADLLSDLARLARELQGQTDPVVVLERVVAVAVRDVPGAEFAGVTVLERAGASTPAATDPLVEQVDGLQYRYGQGPCLDAARQRSVVRSGDLGTESRWPRFAAAAAALEPSSVVSFPLFVDGSSLGALNLYAPAPHAFGPQTEEAGGPLAAHAAVALVSTRERAELRAALDHRDVIGQAKGILMERFTIDAPQAFDLLIAASQRTNTKLYVVAEQLTRTGRIARR